MARAARRDPAFLVVGMPRSGTTLVQRLACELSGVRIPPETHFFAEFLPGLHRRVRFPLDEATLRAELARYCDKHYLRDVPLDIGEIVGRLGGTCRDPVDLFEAIVRQLAGDGRLIGEKTPTHLLWWEPLSAALPDLKVVVVVRDPRAVVVSYGDVGWGGHDLITARRWNHDMTQADAALRALGSERVILLRYEDVVTSPDEARRQLASFLGAEPIEGPAPDHDVDGVLFPAWEAWKSGATEKIFTDRVEAWRRELAPGRQRSIEAVCWRGMKRLGYGPAPNGLAAALQRLRVSPTLRLRTMRRVMLWRRQAAARARIARGWSHVGDPSSRQRSRNGEHGIPQF